jgi:dienelactone hydrolase
MDKYEVTNQAFKVFMDQGGYQNPAFWNNAFVMHEDTLSFDEAMEYFVDNTGRPGPVTWEAGDYPDGQDDYPVNGISWYEAAAFAVFMDKSLPTILHWQTAAGFLFGEYPQQYSSNVIPLSNMAGSGPEPVGSYEGISHFGTYDMAGNVREWCWNKSLIGRSILGGAWNDENYLATYLSQMPAFDRSLKNGFRCVVYPDSVRIPEQVFQPLAPGIEGRDYNFEEPESEAALLYYCKQFLYDKDALDSQIEERTENLEDWYIEKISFNAAYENERMIAYLFLPKEFVPPHQTIIFFPGAYAFNENSLLESINTYWHIDYLLKNGRAVMFPVYKGTYERQDGSCNELPTDTYRSVECTVKWVKDLSRAIDYLETREDIDTSRLGYIGQSWGAAMGAVIPAVEGRLKLCVLILGGLPRWSILPEIDPINYVSRINIPALMLNGRYDPLFPYESSLKPMLDLLGTPDKNKKLVLYDTDHFVPKSEIIKETLNWLDKYFGPVQK